MDLSDMAKDESAWRMMKRKNQPRTHSALRLKVEVWLGHIRTIARNRRGMTSEHLAEAKAHFQAACDAVWFVLTTVHQDDCKCDDCFLARTTEEDR